METPSTVEKAIDVLFHLHRTETPQGVTAIGLSLGLPKSSTHRLLASLGRRQLVERDERGRYRVGIGLVALGLGVLDTEPLVHAAQTVLEEGARQLGETHFLVAARSRRLVVLAKAEGRGFLRASPRVGASLPSHATAVGKLQLAFDPASIEALDAGESLEAFTSKTRTKAGAVGREDARARERGWAENRDEWVEGLSVVAAPIFLKERVAGFLAVAASSSSYGALDGQLDGGLSAHALSAAADIALRLSGEAAGAGGESS